MEQTLSPIFVCPLGEEMIPAAAALESCCFSDGVSEEALRGFVHSGVNHYFAAMADGAVVGYGGFSLVADEAEILSVAADPSLRRRGIGRALTAHMLACAAALGAVVIHLEVRESNKAAIGLYTRLGFETLGRRRNYYTHPREDAILMRRELGVEEELC